MLTDLVTTDVGLFSLITILVLLIIPTYIYFWVRKQIRESEKNKK